MAVTKERVATRIRLADDERKTFATFSRINPEVTLNGADLFADAAAGLIDRTVGYVFLIREDELKPE
ncbi:MAG: hypothetical protein FWF03_06015 [Defluviitaleaceae bacterium]|nr:hypothetical protein [Defluviitaleaceae bacterium]